MYAHMTTLVRCRRRRCVRGRASCTQRGRERCYCTDVLVAVVCVESTPLASAPGVGGVFFSSPKTFTDARRARACVFVHACISRARIIMRIPANCFGRDCCERCACASRKIGREDASRVRSTYMQAHRRLTLCSSSIAEKRLYNRVL